MEIPNEDNLEEYNSISDILQYYPSVLAQIAILLEYVDYNKNKYNPLEYTIDADALLIDSDLYNSLNKLDMLIPKLISKYDDIKNLRNYSNSEIYGVLMLLIKQKTMIRDAIKYIECKDYTHAATKIASIYRAFKCMEVISCKTDVDRLFFIESLIAYNSILDQVVVYIN